RMGILQQRVPKGRHGTRVLPVAGDDGGVAHKAVALCSLQRTAAQKLLVILLGQPQDGLWLGVR
ncbi:MAG: hypothetical protein GWN87_17250, partial [Desulfuromonadales bacterium]|nr:hypothetical protein [Desulfuromonadales bacterium]